MSTCEYLHCYQECENGSIYCFEHMKYGPAEEGCPHQFFLIKRITIPESSWCDCPVHQPSKFGVRVKCALCNEQRDLWENEDVVNE